MALHTWLIYLVAAIGLSLTPGPNSLLVLTHGALHGHRKTLFTVAGGAIGFVALIALSMLGIGALLKASGDALTVLKVLGGAYLVWLGIQLWRALTQWMGGMGILVLVLALLPKISEGSVNLMKAESPGPISTTKHSAAWFFGLWFEIATPQNSGISRNRASV